MGCSQGARMLGNVIVWAVLAIAVYVLAKGLGDDD